MLVTLFPMVTDWSWVNWNAELPMVITESGMMTEVSPEELKALSPMEVTELGMVTVVRLEHPWNCESDICIVPEVMV